MALSCELVLVPVRQPLLDLLRYYRIHQHRLYFHTFLVRSFRKQNIDKIIYFTIMTGNQSNVAILTYQTLEY